jgi:hypothetical protein
MCRLERNLNCAARAARSFWCNAQSIISSVAHADVIRDCYGKDLVACVDSFFAPGLQGLFCCRGAVLSFCIAWGLAGEGSAGVMPVESSHSMISLIGGTNGRNGCAGGRIGNCWEWQRYSVSWLIRHNRTRLSLLRYTTTNILIFRSLPLNCPS